MKNFLLTLLFIFSLSAKSQSYVSGNVTVEMKIQKNFKFHI